ncbi:MAG TPA: hypothetical protein VGO47_09855 [Chlamydiales bacterium]|nr:hypothetical protein [Chlamydiales bacterium]
MPLKSNNIRAVRPKKPGKRNKYYGVTYPVDVFEKETKVLINRIKQEFKKPAIRHSRRTVAFPATGTPDFWYQCYYRAINALHRHDFECYNYYHYKPVSYQICGTILRMHEEMLT